MIIIFLANLAGFLKGKANVNPFIYALFSDTWLQKCSLRSSGWRIRSSTSYLYGSETT